MNFNLKNKYALVCGSTSGIGKATAFLLAEEGAKITLVARNEDKLKQVCAELPNANLHDYIVADFSNPNDLQNKLETYCTTQHGFHILVNNTGGPAAGPIYSATLDAFEIAFTQHLKCNHILVQTLAPFMKEVNYGRIINVISTSVKQPIDGLGVSNTIRGAVASWSKTLSNELGEFGITVNNVLPGSTATQRLFDIFKDTARITGQTEAEIIEESAKSIPVHRFATPEEIANAIVFLASELASYINGINLPVDGGRIKSL
ncbi:SDR family oxidoreductase [Formosa sediminum]|uniref:SDR family oxidoreductase n=1 Tax=Formosa sediminum TaxID=2594004 RepID=A0A516GMG9_9FLAO|nr:SDR family oxidoreductase [Formosa sediminum]QDO92703.1 SDR family oxidoreductase [Formosa sediminum]